MTIETINPFPIHIYKKKAKHHEEIKDYLMKHVYPKFEEQGPNGGLQKYLQIICLAQVQ